MAKYDDLDTKQIFIIGIASVAVTAVTILAVLYVYYLLVDGHRGKLAEQSSYNRQNTILQEQIDSVNQYGADPLTANVTIPINRAMELVVQEAQQQASSDADNQPENANENDAI